MATDISASGSRIKVTIGSAKPHVIPKELVKDYRFSGTNLVFVTEGVPDLPSRLVIPLADLRVAGAGTAPASVAAAETALDALFPDAGSGTGGGATTVTATGTTTIALAANEMLEWIFFVPADSGDYPFNLDMGTTLHGTEIWDAQIIEDSSAVTLPVAAGAARTLYIEGLPDDTFIKYKIA